MPDHIHLFCTPGVMHRESVRKWAGFWKRLASVSNSSLAGVWQRDLCDVQMRSAEQYMTKRFYMAMNPVRAGLVQSPEEWPFSGCLHEIRW